MPFSLTSEARLRVPVLDDKLIDQIGSSEWEEQREWLFLTPHERFAGRWYVDALDGSFFLDFEEQIGKFRTVSPASLEAFLDRADELQYKVAFAEDPFSILSAWDHLNDPPAFSLNSDMEKAVEGTGMLPFQLQGFNFLRRKEIKGGFALWSTGTGKTALEAALIKQHLEFEDWELALVVVKSNNKIDTQRKLWQLGDIESYVIEGTPARREEMYGLFDTILAAGDKLVGITNYEKFRDDEEHITALIEGRKVVFFFDEMPTKLRNRRTQLYQAVNRVLYDNAPQVGWDFLRPAEMRTYQLTATPIENSPLDQLNCIRLQDPNVFPTIKGWEKRFVATRNYFNKEPETFKNQDEMGLVLDFMTHQVDKEDPDIAEMFPAITEEIVYIDWGEDRRYYDKVQEIAKDLAERAKGDPTVKKFNPLQVIGVLQMLCDAPSMVQKSAENREEFEALLDECVNDEELAAAERFISGSEAALTLVESQKKPLTDEHSQKIDKLREIICEKHPDEKVVVFSALSESIQDVLVRYFEEWGVTYTVFRGTEKQRQEAKDKFRCDPDIQVFLSSDAGSDSIDLPEASVVVHFDLPWKWSTLVQRQNRAHRVNSTHERVVFYTLLMVNSVEDRKVEIIAKKLGFHRGIFKGEISEEAISARMTAEDLWYILTGEAPEG